MKFLLWSLCVGFGFCLTFTEPEGKEVINNQSTDDGYLVDLYATGFKVKPDGTNDINRVDADYFFAAWADIPTTNMFGQATTTHFSGNTP